MADLQEKSSRESLESFLVRYKTADKSFSELKKECDTKLFAVLGLNYNLTLLTSLGLEQVDNLAIVRDNQKDKDKVIALFLKWKATHGCDATYLALISALLKCEEVEAAEQVCGYLDMELSNISPASVPTEGSLERQPQDEPQKRYLPISYSKSDQVKAPCEKDTSNIAWQIFDRFHDELVDVIRGDDKLCQSLLEELYQCFLIGSAEKEVIQQLLCIDIRSKAIMGRISTFISKGRNPIGSLAKFVSVLKSFEVFSDINRNLLIEARYAHLELRDVHVSHSAKKSLPVSDKIATSATKYDEDLMTDSITKYSRHMRRYYKKLKPDPKWSMDSAPSKVYVDLAVLNKDEVCSDPFSKSTIHGIDDDIFQRKDPLSLDELCNIEYGDAILIEGAPGIGKSMLAFEICSRWVKEKGLMGYTLLLLFRLREKFVQDCKTAKELLSCFLVGQSWKDEVVGDIIDNSGEGVIIILEGFDELPHELTTPDSVFLRLTSELPSASYIFTSRPSAKHCLKQEISFERHVEVIGFTKPSIEKYVTEFFKGNCENITSFNQHLEESPKIRDSLYIPVNLVIVCTIFEQSITNEEQVPLKGIVTSTKLYDVMIRTLLYRHIKSQNLAKSISIPDLNTLPSNVAIEFKKICGIAYNGLREKKTKLLFYANDECETFGSNFETLGIMQKEIQLYPGKGDVIVYSFLHLTIQEFLAAYHVSRLSRKEIKEHFHRYKNVRNLATMLRFLAGLTELKSITISVNKELYNMNTLHCLYESGDESIISRLFNKSHEIFKIRRLLPKATPQDMYIIGRCIALSNCQWELSFTLRGVTHDHIERLQRGLCSKISTSCKINEISFSLNPIGDKGMVEFLCFPDRILNHLVSLRLSTCELQLQSAIEFAKRFDKFNNLSTLLYHNNRFHEGNQRSLLEAMIPMHNIKRVSFSKLSSEECSLLLTKIPNLSTVELYQLGSDSIKALVECLPCAASLRVVRIEQSQCLVENLRQLPKALSSSTLHDLELINCAIDSDIVPIIVEAVLESTHLVTLGLRDNFIGDKGGILLCEMLKQFFSGTTTNRHHNNLKFLDIGHNNLTEVGVSDFITQLASLKVADCNFTLVVSLSWKNFETKLSCYSDAEKFLKFDRNED